MPLNLTLKPNEKLIVNGAVLSNNSPRSVTLSFHNKAQLLQQKDVLLPEEAEVVAASRSHLADTPGIPAGERHPPPSVDWWLPTRRLNPSRGRRSFRAVRAASH